MSEGLETRTHLKQFSQTLTYRHTACPQELIADMHTLAEFDKNYEDLLGLWRKRRMVTGLVFVAALIWLFVSAGDYAAVGASVLSLAAFVFAFSKVSKYKKYDIKNARYQLVDGVVAILKVDMAPEAELLAEVDFRPHTEKPVKRAYKSETGWNVQEYFDDWLTLRGRLLDGTKFTLRAKERIRACSKTKRSASGKRKVKRKQTGRSYFSLKLEPKASQVISLENMQTEMTPAIQLPPWAHLKRTAVQKNGLFLDVSCEPDWVVLNNGNNDRCGTHLTAMMFLSLYQVINLGKLLQQEGARSA